MLAQTDIKGQPCSGRVTVTGRVVEVTPNVTGQIVTIPVKPNVPVKTNDVLFQIDPAPFQYKVAQLQASLAGAKQQVEILKSNYELATANVSGLTAQAAYNKKPSCRHRDAGSGCGKHGISGTGQAGPV